MSREPKRGRVKLSLIESRAARRQSFRKRRAGLVKKMTELTTLCAVEGCAIIKAPNEDQLLVWPSAEDAHQVIQRFRNLPEEQRTMKMDDQRSYLRESLTKVRGQCNKVEEENQEKSTKFLMFDALRNPRELSANPNRIEGLREFVSKYIKDIDMRLSSLNKETQGEAGPSTGIGGLQSGGKDMQAKPTMDPNLVNRGASGSHGMMTAPHHNVFPDQY